MKLSIKEICEQRVSPAIEARKWDRSSQISFCEDDDYEYNELDTEYVLFYKSGTPVAVISVVEADSDVEDGIDCAIKNAELLDIPCAFSCNGEKFLFYNRNSPQKQAKQMLYIDKFPYPKELWKIYNEYKNRGQNISETKNIDGTNHEQKFPLLKGVLMVGAGVLSALFKVSEDIFSAGKNKRVLYLHNSDDFFTEKNASSPQQLEFQQSNESGYKKLRDNKSVYQAECVTNSNNIVNRGNSITNTNNQEVHIVNINDLPKNEKYEQYPTDYFDSIITDINDVGHINSRGYHEVLNYFADTLHITVKPQEIGKKSDVVSTWKPVLIEVFKRTNDEPSLKRPNSNVNNVVESSGGDRRDERKDTTASNNSYTNTYQTNNISDKNINTTNNITINITTMARSENFGYQIELALELKNFLIRLQENLAEAAKMYQNTSSNLYEAGMMEEKHLVLEGYMNETNSLISNTVNKIAEADIPFVDRYIRYLEESDSVK